ESSLCDRIGGHRSGIRASPTTTSCCHRQREAVHVDFTVEERRTTTTWKSSLLDITSAHGRGPRNTS
ncbi:unnamed protein product, partial [Brassica rapa subsp. trilocularis]